MLVLVLSGRLIRVPRVVPPLRPACVRLGQEGQAQLFEAADPVLDPLDADPELPGDRLDRLPLVERQQGLGPVELLAAPGPLDHAPHPALARHRSGGTP